MSTKRKPLRDWFRQRPGTRGWPGPGRGESPPFKTPAEYRGSTRQVCGLWPFSVGAGAPISGVPIGRHLDTLATIGCDPISYFMDGIIPQPSAFIEGIPAVGKSSLARRMVTGLAAFGTIPMVLGDIKPDYVDLIQRMGGQTISIRSGIGYLNVLDPGDVASAIARLRAAVADARAEGERVEAQLRHASADELVDLAARADELLELAARQQRLMEELAAEAHERKKTMTTALLKIQRGKILDDWEETLIDQAITLLERREGVPIMQDLLDVIVEGAPELREITLDGGDYALYTAQTKALQQSLLGLIRGGRLGTTFSRHTTQPQLRDKPVVYDVSGISKGEEILRGAVLLACWSAGFATINASHALTEAGLEPRRNYLVVMDEIHRALQSGPHIVDNVDLLTRTNRQEGVGTIMITHTMKDLLSLRTDAENQKALGLIERSAMVILGGLPRGEMPLLERAVRLSRKEQDLLGSWTDPAPINPKTGVAGALPGRGKFLIKMGGAPAIPFKMELVPSELAVHDTNKRWHHASAVGHVDREGARA